MLQLVLAQVRLIAARQLTHLGLLNADARKKRVGRFPPEVDQMLLAAGWFPGRNTRADAPFPAASSILSEFGGIHVGEAGPGMERGRDDVHIDPSLGGIRASELEGYERVLGHRLYAVASICNDHAMLAVDELGRVYFYSDIGLDETQVVLELPGLPPDEIWIFAPSFDRALELELLGKRPTLKELRQAWAERSVDSSPA